MHCARQLAELWFESQLRLDTCDTDPLMFPLVMTLDSTLVYEWEFEDTLKYFGHHEVCVCVEQR